MFTQTRVDEQGRPVRDEAFTSYVAAIETAEDFGLRLYTEAWNRGWSRANKKVVLGDGAVWIWNLADQHLANAMQIVDLYHARQHLWELTAPFVGSGVAEAGCKTVVGRLKQSGMFWTVRGANAILALRCNRLSGKFEDYWESRARAA